MFKKKFLYFPDNSAMNGLIASGFHTGFSVWGGRIFSEIFPEVYNLAKILLALPVGTATVENRLVT